MLEKVLTCNDIAGTKTTALALSLTITGFKTQCIVHDHSPKQEFLSLGLLPMTFSSVTRLMRDRMFLKIEAVCEFLLVK